MLAYLAGLRYPMVILWCYFCWYIAMLVFYFEPDIQVWLTSLGLSFIIGLAYNLNAMSRSAEKVALDPWIAFRFFFMPLCVSSFAGLIKGKGFFMIFPSNWIENATGLALCLMFLTLVWISRRFYAEGAESKS